MNFLKLSPLLFALLFSLFPVLTFGQNTYLDSLLNNYHKIGLTNSNIVIELNRKSSDLIDSGEYDKAMNCAKKAYDISDDTKDVRGKYNALNNIGNVYLENGKTEDAIQTFNQCINIGRTQKDSSKICSAYKQLGKAYYNAGQYEEAKSSYAPPLQYALHHNDLVELNDIYNNIGNVHTRTAEYKKAAEYYLKCMTISEELSNTEGIIDAHNNLAVVATHQANLSQALEHLKKCVELACPLNDFKRAANANHNIGNIYYIIGKYALAEPYYKEALDMRLRINDKYGLTESYNNLGVIAERMGDNTLALDYLNQAKKLQFELNARHALTAAYMNEAGLLGRMGLIDRATDTLQKGINLAQKLGIKENVKEAYGILYDMHKKQKNFEQAMYALEQYNLMKDSLLNENTQQAIQELRVQFDSEKKEKENIELTQQRDRQIHANELLNREKLIATLNFTSELDRRLLAEAVNKQQEDSLSNLQERNAIQNQLLAQEQQLRSQEQVIHQKQLHARNLGLWLLAVIFVLGGVITWLLVRNRKRRTLLILNELEEKALRAQLNPHFIFNALASIQAMVTSQPAQARQYLTRFSHFTQEVLANSEKESIPLKDELTMLKRYIELQNLRLNRPFTHEFKLDETIDQEEVLVPPAIFQPLIENSINHNFTGKATSGNLLVQISRKSGMLECEVTDSCEGEKTITKAEPLKIEANQNSFGLRIVRDRLNMWARGKGQKGYLELKPHPTGMQVLLGIPT